MKKAIISILTVWVLVNVGLFSLIILSPEIEVQVSATTIIVDDDGTPGVDCNYTTIQEGIDAANPGDTVFVKNGTYYENVIVNKTINLTGVVKETTIIDSGGWEIVVLITADWVNVSGFTVTNSGGFWGDMGMKLSNVQNCRIVNNNVSNNRHGIFLSSSSSNTITNNTASSNSFEGIGLVTSIGNTIFNNEMVDNGISIEGDMVEHWNTHTIDTTNTVNGKPVYYWKNQTGGTVPLGAGQVILANSTKVIVENQNFSDGSIGIEFGFSSRNTITNNTASSNMWGIRLYSSSSNTIANNTASSNNVDGIYLYYSDSNTIANNNASSNGYRGIYLLASSSNTIGNNNALNNNYGILIRDSSDSNNITNNNASNNSGGIVLDDSSSNNITNNNASNNSGGIFLGTYSNSNNITNNTASNNNYGIYIRDLSDSNTITNNTVTSNDDDGIHLYWANSNTIANNTVSSNKEYGIRLSLSNSNKIFHNNILGNTNQAYDDTNNGNQWDNGYPFGGNYWSDYTGIDHNSTANQDVPPPDGIGDTPYIIDSNSQDNYPLMEPYPFIMDYENPTADAGEDQSIYEDESCLFDGSSSYDNIYIINWTWDFDDGTFGYGTYPTHSYPLSGEYIVQLNVTDGGGNWDTDIVIINVSNVPPIADAGNDITTYEGEWVTFNGSGSSDTLSDMDSLVYIWNFGDANNGSGITIAHVYSDNGIYNVTLNVTDDDGNTSIDNITVTIINTPPQIFVIPPQVLLEDEPYNLQVNATDIGADTITYADNTSLFDIDPFTGDISFTPTNDDVGVHLINITATDDDGGLSYIEILLDIQNTNDAPIITSTPETTVWQNTTYYYNATAIDDDNDPLNYSLELKPEGMTIDSYGRITWIPNNSQVGENSVVVKVIDPAGSNDTQEYSISVINVNDAPIITSTPETIINEKAVYYYNITAYDIDNDTLSFELELMPEGMSIDSNGRITWVPNNSQVGENNINVNVTDSNGAFICQEFMIIVENTNDAPILEDIDFFTLNEDEVFTYSIYVTDIDYGDVLTFSDNTDLFEIDSATGNITFHPTNDDVGAHTVIITVTDSNNESDSVDILFTINNVNDFPSVESVEAFTAVVGKAFNYSIIASDIDLGDHLTYSDDSDLFDIDSSSGLISFIPDKNDVGEYRINITITDSAGATNHTSFTLHIISEEKDTAEPKPDYSWILWVLIAVLIAFLFGFMLKKRKEKESSQEELESKPQAIEFELHEDETSESREIKEPKNTISSPEETIEFETIE